MAAVGLDYGRIYGMANSLVEAGAELRRVYDPDLVKVKRFLEAFPQAAPAESEARVLKDPSLRLMTSVCVLSERAAQGVRALETGKHYFADKPPPTNLEQLDQVRRAAAGTGFKYMVKYTERLHSESDIGRVVQIIGLGPHRINLSSRPHRFFEHERYGGIIYDIGSHQIE